MSRERLPIRFFAPREVDSLRIEPGGSSEPPRWLLTGDELIERASRLSAELIELETLILERETKSSPIPFVFKAEINNDSTAKSRRREVSELFQTSNRSSVLGLSASNELIVRMDSVSDMGVVSSRLRNYERNSFAISCLEKLTKYEPIFVKDQSTDTYKAKLIDFQDHDQNTAIQRFFEREALKKDISYKKTEYSKKQIIYRLTETGKASLDELTESEIFGALFSIEPMPKYFLTLDSLVCEDTIEILLPDENEKYSVLGILDTGIASIPHLKPWMLDEKWPANDKSNTDQSHGTFVSGVALYGDASERKKWVGHRGIKLFDATVLPDGGKTICEDELIQNIKEAVKAHHNKVKIWNLSISCAREVKDTRFSDFAVALDGLQDEYDILICKSAGNCTNFANNGPKGRIFEGADSVRSLVVGSVAHKKGEFDLSEIDCPSPFSRVGPGPEYIIKPEVSHYGGNAGIDGNGKRLVTGVKSFSPDGQLTTSIGTSFSTPRVASLAACIHQELDEEFDPLLIKALIVHSASYPKNLEIPLEERTKHLGFGIPKAVGEILYNSPNDVTLILRDSLAKGHFIDIMDFPMPTSLIKEEFFTGQIVVTLVYDPILDPSQGNEYCQSNIDIKFGSYDQKEERDTEKNNILNPGWEQCPESFIRWSL